MSVREATRHRIESAHRFGPSYGGGLANHLPMALVALDQLGAGEERIAAFEARHAAVLEPCPPAGKAVGNDEEAACLGHPGSFARWLARYAREIGVRGSEAVLREWLPRLAPGLGSGAFHGAIRAAYAVESGSDAELAHALAYWACAFDPIAAHVTPGGTLPPMEVLEALHRERGGRRMPGGGIAARLRAAVAEAAWANAVESTDPRALDRDAIASAAIGAYGASGDFTVLHAVTGCDAFATLLPHMADPGEATTHLWRAVVGAYLGTGAPPVRGWAVPGRDDLDWPAIRARAIACDDEHDVKLVHSCWRESRRRDDDRYRRAASARACHATREEVPC